MARGSILSLGIVSGMLSARLLEPPGQGRLAAITIWALALMLLAGCGMNQANVYQISMSRHTYARICGPMLAIGVRAQPVVLARIIILPLALCHCPPGVLRIALWVLAFTPVMMPTEDPANLLQATASGPLSQYVTGRSFRCI